MQWKKGPVPNVSTTPLVGGQWQAGTGGELELRIVNNKDEPSIKTNGKLRAALIAAPPAFTMKAETADDRAMSGPAIFDRTLLRARQQRARALGAETFLIDRVAAELGERLAVVLRQFDRAVDLGTPTDAVRRVLAAKRQGRRRSSPPWRRRRGATFRA